MKHPNDVRSGVHIYSEIGCLRRVLLHRPGLELDNITPTNMYRLLFDELPYQRVAEEEHRAFSSVFENAGVEVFYLEDLFKDVLRDHDVRRAFLYDFLKETRVGEAVAHDMVEILDNGDDLDKLISVVFGGWRFEDFDSFNVQLRELDRQRTLWFDPLPNLYFTRDPMSIVGSGVMINCMWSKSRDRETLIYQYIVNHHPMFHGLPRYLDRSSNATFEGGDILVLSPQVIAVGVSQRSDSSAVKTIARNILNADAGFEHVLAFIIPEQRAFMHLDTVFTMIDRDIFTIHPEVEGPLEIFDIRADKDGTLTAKSCGGHLEKVLKTYLGLSEIELIRCGGTSRIDAQREQWNDASNTLAIAPGEVIVYERNGVTNQLLREAGVILHEIASSELSRGRGGPRCMSSPLWRDDLVI